MIKALSQVPVAYYVHCFTGSVLCTATVTQSTATGTVLSVSHCYTKHCHRYCTISQPLLHKALPQVLYYQSATVTAMIKALPQVLCYQSATVTAMIKALPQVVYYVHCFTRSVLCTATVTQSTATGSVLSVSHCYSNDQSTATGTVLSVSDCYSNDQSTATGTVVCTCCPATVALTATIKALPQVL